MIIRLISLVTGLVTLDVYLQSQLFSNGPLFYLVSDNLFVNIFMILLAAAGVWLAFRGNFKSWYSYAICSALAIVMLVFGVAGFLFDSVIYSLWSLFSPLNYMLLLQFGIIFALCSLSFKHAKRPKNVHLPAFSTLVSKFKFALPVPKTPHIPQALGRESAHGTN